MLTNHQRILIATALTADVISRASNWLRILFGVTAIVAILYALRSGRIPRPEYPQLDLAAAAVLAFKLGRWVRFEF
jgi:hypothetical protein